MFSSGKIHYEVGANIEAMSYGGIAPIYRMLTKLGLPDLINDNLKLLKRYLPYHESDHVLNMAYNVQKPKIKRLLCDRFCCRISAGL